MTDLFGVEDLDDDSDGQENVSKQKQGVSDSEAAVEEVMNELLDEMALGLCFEVHRACKLGTLFLDETDEVTQKQYGIFQGKGKDVFGQGPVKRQYDCICPNCQRNLAASRFAPHLEKCMGMGRNSSRLASRRLANHQSGRRDSDNDSDDNENDHDWSYLADKKAKKLKKEKNSNNNSPRRNKNSKHRNGDPSSSSGTLESSSQPLYESMSIEERKALLIQICGVISEHTKKMCTRSVRCPQHTEEQRKAVRHTLLGQTSIDGEEIHIDIDTYDDSESQILRDALQWEAQSNPSPADSTSTTGSISRKRKSKQSKKKNKNTNSASTTNTPASTYDFM